MIARIRRAARPVAIRLEIDATELRVQATLDADALWTVSIARAPDESLGAAIAAVLSRLPRFGGRLRAPRITVVLDDEFVRAKRIDGLPEIDDLATLSDVVREGAARFFIGEPGSLLTSDVIRDADGVVRAAAFRRRAIEEVLRAFDAARAPEPTIVPRANELLCCPPLVRGPRRISSTRAVCAVGTVVVAVAIAMLAPVAVATRTEARARAELARLAVGSRTAMEDLGELAAASQVVAAFERQESARRSTLGLLAQVAAALPSSTALVMLRIDSAGGTLVAVGPRAGAVVTRLDSVPVVDGPEIVGPVTREVIGGRELERVTVRFAHREPR